MNTIVTCENCQQPFEKNITDINRSKHHYCSKSCANTMSNKKRWAGHIKRSERHKCEICNKPRDHRGKYTLCMMCRINSEKENNKKITIGEIRKKHNDKKTIRWYSSEVRNFTRTWNPHLINTPCQVCGYSTHTELCHIKPIGEADDNTTLGEINDPSNILVLCPNHHWEFDNNILTLEQIKNGAPGGS